MRENETVGSRIRALRKQFKLTQAELAKIADVTPPNVTAWEKDSYLPKTGPLDAMSNYFGVTQDYLLCKSNSLEGTYQEKLYNQSLQKRLIDSRGSVDKSPEQIAIEAGIPLEKYLDLESGKTIKSAFLPIVAKVLNVDAYWLTTGKNEASLFEDNLSSPTVTTEGSNDGFIWVDVVQANFSCGPGEDIDFHFDRINGRFPFPPSFFKDKKVMPDTMRIIKAKGDSMADYIKDGDFVGIDISHTTIEDGEIYAVYFAGEGMLKQIFKEADGSLILHSHNEKYRDRTVSEENGQNFKVIGRQFWRAG